jgi:hypothetical protein
MIYNKNTLYYICYLLTLLFMPINSQNMFELELILLTLTYYQLFITHINFKPLSFITKNSACIK